LATVTKKRVVSGMRPTGRLHLGHLVGALDNWVALQREYDCYYFVADWHALTSHYNDTGDIVASALDNVADWIGCGIDPERSTIFVQSLVPEHAELYLRCRWSRRSRGWSACRPTRKSPNSSRTAT
jgi:tryptophanyl-tRNA synthetase